MANIITGYTASNNLDPKFEFIIKKEDFFINTPGFSINLAEKSYSNYVDGNFYLLNSNSVPVYYKGLVFNNARLRTDVSSISKTLTVNSLGTTGTTTNIYESFSCSYRGSVLGTLTLEYPIEFYNNVGKMIAPFESVKFSAIYKVENLNKVELQYFGASKKSIDKKVGLLDFNFQLETYSSGELNEDSLVVEPITISCYVVNTGFIPNSLVTEPENYEPIPTYE